MFPNLFDLIAKALPKISFFQKTPKHSKHQATKRGYRHANGNRHERRREVIPTQHERVFAARCARDPQYRQRAMSQDGAPIGTLADLIA
jgi:hypothetical protein